MSFADAIKKATDAEVYCLTAALEQFEPSKAGGLLDATRTAGNSLLETASNEYQRRGLSWSDFVDELY